MPTRKASCGCIGHRWQETENERGTDPTSSLLLVRRLARPRQSVALRRGLERVKQVESLGTEPTTLSGCSGSHVSY